MAEKETIEQAIPILRVEDAAAALPWYERLGFVKQWEHQFEPGFPLFLQLTRAGQMIFLTEHTGDCQAGGAVYFIVPDVDACYRDFSARGIVRTEGPQNTPWGTREMVIVDPDGNRLRFAT